MKLKSCPLCGGYASTNKTAYHPDSNIAKLNGQEGKMKDLTLAQTAKRAGCGMPKAGEAIKRLNIPTADIRRIDNSHTVYLYSNEAVEQVKKYVKRIENKCLA